MGVGYLDVGLNPRSLRLQSKRLTETLRFRSSRTVGRHSTAELGADRKLDLQRLSQCGSTYKCQSRSVLEIH